MTQIKTIQIRSPQKTENFFLKYVDKTPVISIRIIFLTEEKLTQFYFVGHKLNLIRLQH